MQCWMIFGSSQYGACLLGTSFPPPAAGTEREWGSVRGGRQTFVLTGGSQSKSYQAHCLHSFSKHGFKSLLRKYVLLTHCLVCLREFHTRENCLNHIRYRSKICRSNLLMRGPWVLISHVCADCPHFSTLVSECKQI